MPKVLKITTLQYLKKEVRVEVDCADKHQSFLQVGTIIFNGLGQACLKYSQ